MARRRMYLFERAYVDYGGRFLAVVRFLFSLCGGVWRWFWSGPGAMLFEVLLRIAVIVTAVILCWMYVKFELAHGRHVTIGTISTIAVLFIFVFIALWGWKAPIHLLARLVSAMAANAVIILLSSVFTAVIAVAFTLYLLALFVLTALSFIIFLPMRTGQELWLLYRRVRYHCPYGCGATGLPIHVCACGEEYHDLLPSFYGIFYHVCRHADGDVKLPTMDFLGRNRLTRLCRGCKHLLTARGDLGELPVLVIGGPSSGKSVFISQVLRELLAAPARLPGSKIRLDSSTQQRKLEADLSLLDNGQLLAKTLGDTVQAYGLELRIPKRCMSLLHLYDAPGEHFRSVEQFARKQVIRHLHGIVLLVDPFTLSMLSSSGQQLGGLVNPASTTFNQDVEVLINGVNQMLVRRTTDRCEVPIAVVLAKADAFPADQLPFLSGLVSADGRRADDASSARCRQALEQLGGGNGIRSLEAKFLRVRYFACSALGHTPESRNRTPFRPQGVTDPLLWLIGLDLEPGVTRVAHQPTPWKARVKV